MGGGNSPGTSPNTGNYSFLMFLAALFGSLFAIHGGKAEDKEDKVAGVAHSTAAATTIGQSTVLAPFEKFLGAESTFGPSQISAVSPPRSAAMRPVPTGSAAVQGPSSQPSPPPSARPSATHSSTAKSVGTSPMASDDPWRPFESRLNQQVASVDFLLTVVTDAVDTPLRYRFDRQLEMLHRVCAADGFVLDGCYLPWSPESPGAHHSQPGLLLYRGSVGKTFDSRKTKLLAVYLVGETPTGGVHRAAFLEAVRQIATFHQRSPSELPSTAASGTIMISGPGFSGAAESLARAIRSARVEGSPAEHSKFIVINGSSLAIDSARFVQLAGGDPERVTLLSTVASGRQLIRALIDYATRGKPTRVAWLTESSSGYGASTESQINSKLMGPGDSGQIETFQFPFNISRVRGIYQQQRRANSPGSTLSERYRVMIPFDEETPSFDTPKLQTPDMTAPSVELTLGQIVSSIRRQGIEFVGISSSDIRDPVFLAEYIKEQVPDTQILLATSDLLHLHSEYRRTMHGTLVASSYSLNPLDQQWCFPHRGRERSVVLPSQDLFGVYNAIVFLRGLQAKALVLGAKDELRFVRKGDRSAPAGAKLELARPEEIPLTTMLSYGMPLDPPDKLRHAPPIWISMIGTSEFIPLECRNAEPIDDPRHLNLLSLSFDDRPEPTGVAGSRTATAPYMDATKSPRSATIAPTIDMRIDPSSEFAMWCWISFAAVYCWRILIHWDTNFIKPLLFSSGGMHVTHHPALVRKLLWPRRGFRLIFTFMLWSIAAVIGTIAGIPFLLNAVHQVLLNGALCIVAGLTLCGLSALICYDVRLFVRDIANAILRRGELSDDSSIGYAGRLAAAFVIVLAVFVGTELYFRWIPSVDALLFFVKWSDTWNGVSHFLPLSLLAAAVLVLSHDMLSQMRRLFYRPVIPVPKWKPALSPPEDQPHGNAEAILQLLYPVTARIKNPQSVVLNCVVIVVVAVWLWSLFVRTATTSLTGDLLCLSFLFACAFWGLRFIKTLEVCRALQRFLKNYAHSSEKQPFDIKRWSEIVQRVGTDRGYSLNMLREESLESNHVNSRLARARELYVAARHAGRDIDCEATLKLAEDYYILHIETYIRQTFIHIFNLTTGLIASSVLLYLAAQSLPFNSEPLMQTTALCILIALAAAVCIYYAAFDRDEFLSTLIGTVPFKLTWNWSLIHAIAAPVALALFGIFGQMFPEMWTWLRGLLEPLTRAAG